MTKRYRSISERLRSAKTLDVKTEIAFDWAKNWQGEVDQIISQLENTIMTGDRGRLCSITGELKEVSRKRFLGLQTVIKHLSEDEDE